LDFGYIQAEMHNLRISHTA